jgi:hypothetical protein
LFLILADLEELSQLHQALSLDQVTREVNIFELIHLAPVLFLDLRRVTGAGIGQGLALTIPIRETLVELKDRHMFHCHLDTKYRSHDHEKRTAL